MQEMKKKNTINKLKWMVNSIETLDSSYKSTLGLSSCEW